MGLWQRFAKVRFAEFLCLTLELQDALRIVPRYQPDDTATDNKCRKRAQSDPDIADAATLYFRGHHFGRKLCRLGAEVLQLKRSCQFTDLLALDEYGQGPNKVVLERGRLSC